MVEQSYQVFVRTLTGKTITLRVFASETVDALKKQVESKVGVPVDEQRLVCASRQLESRQTLSECGVCAETTVQLLLRLRGGSPMDAAERKITDAEKAVSELAAQAHVWCEEEHVLLEKVHAAQLQVRGFQDDLVREQQRLDSLDLSSWDKATRRRLYARVDAVCEELEEIAGVLRELERRIKMESDGLFRKDTREEDGRREEGHADCRPKALGSECDPPRHVER